MLTWDKVLSLLYALLSKKKKKKRLQLSCYSIMYYLHLPFLFERANYNYYSPICVVSVFILVYSLNVYRFIDSSFINCPGLGSARTIVKVFPLCKWKKRLSQSSLRTFFFYGTQSINREHSIFYLEIFELDINLIIVTSLCS